MSASASSDPIAALAEGLGVSAVESGNADAGILSRIDFALVVDKKLLLYGWVVGFFDSVDTAFIDLGGWVVDLTKHAVPVRRPDVAEHFALSEDNHGFYALVDLPLDFSTSLVDDLKLYVTLSSGQSAESRWAVSCHEGRAAQAIGPHYTTLKRVLRQLSKQEAKRLIDFARPALGPEVKKQYLPSLPPPVQFGIDVCCVLEGQVLVVAGWRLDPVGEVTLAELRVGGSAFRFLEDGISFVRPDIHSELAVPQTHDGPQLPGFIFVHALSPHDAEEDEVSLLIRAGIATVKLDQPLINIPHEARRNLLSLIGKMEADSALVLIDHLAHELECCPDQRSLAGLLALVRNTTIERLPSSIRHVNPRYSLHIDQVIPVAGDGIFLMGWCNVEPGALLKIECHCGPNHSVISDNWSRHTRADVTAHLAGLGVPTLDHEHGFSCYVRTTDADKPCYLSVSSGSGEVRRMRVPVPDSPEAALQTVRSLVTSFNPGTAGLIPLLDGQIGPAVSAAWAARKKPSIAATVRAYGPPPVDPPATVIVPLYGRYDFADYQMAMYADDPDFQSVELIYVVDDPAILEDFSRTCVDLYGTYQVPFIVAYPGMNLGFAGANNFASGLARGNYLVLMNSDVMPRQSGWIADLLRTYRSLANPGVLGVKLLYEDGSIQHAGMAFRRYPGWGNLWINDHPLKGQSPLGLRGIHEIDAVTAACAMIEASLFRELGGFCEDYIIGDFEDSDLCLRLKSAGRQNYISLDVELYHLERQSQNRVGDVHWRANLTLYNCWLHNSRWGKVIEQLAETHTLPRVL